MLTIKKTTGNVSFINYRLVCNDKEMRLKKLQEIKDLYGKT